MAGAVSKQNTTRPVLLFESEFFTPRG